MMTAPMYQREAAHACASWARDRPAFLRPFRFQHQRVTPCDVLECSIQPECGTECGMNGGTRVRSGGDLRQAWPVPGGAAAC